MNNVWVYLQEIGFSNKTARGLSQHELRSWSEQDLDRVFSRIDATNSEIAAQTLRSFSVKYHNDRDKTDFLKPAWKMVQESGRTLGALCVNGRGEFSFRQPGSYAALTHVWEEGLRTDDYERGLHRSLLEQIFMKIQPLGIRWLWIDSLSIPGPADLFRKEGLQIKTNLINAMASIYRQAKQVIVMDALVLRLRSVDPVDTAVVLCCEWITRFWTYQEIKFAADAIVITGAGSVNFSTIITELTSRARQNPRKYRFLAHTMQSLERNDCHPVTLSDIVVGCKDRQASVKLDYARALFAILNLEWRPNFSLEIGMKMIYESQKAEAMKLVLYHGPPRAKHLGWAPAVLSGMRNNEIANPVLWTGDGLVGYWCAYNIQNVFGRGANRRMLMTAAGQSGSHFVSEAPIFEAYASPEEDLESIRRFEDAIRKGSAYILTLGRLDEDRLFFPLRVGLAVDRAHGPTGNSAWVCLTLAIKKLSVTISKPYWQAGKWLLFHENPTCPTPADTTVREHEQPQEPAHFWEEPDDQLLQDDQSPNSHDIQVSPDTGSSVVYDQNSKQWVWYRCQGDVMLWDEQIERWVESTTASVPVARIDCLLPPQHDIAIINEVNTGVLGLREREDDIYIRNEEDMLLGEVQERHEPNGLVEGFEEHHDKELRPVQEYKRSKVKHRSRRSKFDRSIKRPKPFDNEDSGNYNVAEEDEAIQQGDRIEKDKERGEHTAKEQDKGLQKPESVKKNRHFDKNDSDGEEQPVQAGDVVKSFKLRKDNPTKCKKQHKGKKQNPQEISAEDAYGDACHRIEKKVSASNGSKDTTQSGTVQPSKETVSQQDQQQPSLGIDDPSTSRRHKGEKSSARRLKL
ncbi:hypothetical protein QC764_0021420 [Podospora pseudoanserina]|uniref:Heterokaryon incompatibility domain-containing protein n=1 Tax=Podospora pseudoanserina TaxID=2609844 RepID=A0ABR0IQI2_9PEZI|nr:hypothetical protein QC764_0021420 [Podospora pseudoanserina]